LGFQMTPIERRTQNEQVTTPAKPTDDDKTHYRSPIVVRPEEPPRPHDPAPLHLASSYEIDLTDARSGTAAPIDHTQQRPRPTPTDPSAPQGRQPEREGGRRWWKVAAAATVVVVGVLAAVVVLSGRGKGGRPEGESAATSGVDATTPTLSSPLLPPTDVAARFIRDGAVEVTWKAPAGTAVDEYRVARVDTSPSIQTTKDTKLVIDGLAAGVTPCVQLESVRAGRVSSQKSTVACATR
jgi:hypothetical protein